MLSARSTVLLVLGKVNVRPLVGAIGSLGTEPRRLAAGGARERLYAYRPRAPRAAPPRELGVLHGLTNLGGGVLTVIVSSLETDKHRVRAQIAFCYGLVGIIRSSASGERARRRGSRSATSRSGCSSAIVVAATASVDWNLLLPVFAAATYAVVGRHAFAAVRGPTYQHSLTGLIGAYGAVLLLA